MSQRSSRDPAAYPVLSLPVSQLKSSYDIVVVGSGYGAGVAASRMARAGKSVAVLEVGNEWRAGSFPTTFKECVRQLNVSGFESQRPSKRERLFKKFVSEDEAKLFQLRTGEGQRAFCAHGLGGGSLINAGVFLEATPETLSMSAWPEDIREDVGSMNKYYARAASMLQPRTYPNSKKHPPLAKTQNLRDAASWLGEQSKFSRIPLTMTFDQGRNTAGVLMQPNEGSGNECTGLNDGSKNSIPVTYLVDAWNWGAEIFTGCQVRYVEENDGEGEGYVVHFAQKERATAVFGEERVSWVKAKEFCFLGAGALGTTEILLRSKQHGLGVSPMIGRNMSGNGDLLTFGYNGTQDINGLAGSKKDLKSGPTITSMIDLRQEKGSESDPNPLAGYVIEDGAIPSPFAPIIQALLIWQTLSFWNLILAFLRSPITQINCAIAALKSLILGPYTAGGAVQRTATYLIMSHDSSEVRLTLESDKPRLRGVGEGRAYNIGRIRGALKYMLDWSGAGMGFSYFYGVNPLATITALAERTVDLVAQENGLTIDLATENGEIDRDSKPMITYCDGKIEDVDDYVPTGWRFTESLDGHVGTATRASEPVVAEREGKNSVSQVHMLLTVNIHRRIQGSGPRYRGLCAGTVSCGALSQRTMRVVKGKLDFFVSGEDSVDGTMLRYSLPLDTVEGRRLTLNGVKTLDSSHAFSISGIWKATTTVNVAVQDGKQRIGAGVLHIPLSSFRKQVRTFQTTAESTLSDLPVLLMFLLYFLYQLVIVFFNPLILRFFAHRSAQTRFEAMELSSSQTLITADGVEVKLTIYAPVTQDNMRQKPPVLLLPGITGTKVEHSLYTLPYQKMNMAQYFTSRGHQCYVLTHRWSHQDQVAKECTVFDSRFDVAAALAYVAANEPQSPKPYIVAHCQGSVGLAMALLTGTVKPTQILGITANSVFMNQVFPYWNAIKAWSPALIRLYEFFDGPYFPTSFIGKRKDIVQHILDHLVALYPVPRRDRCTSSACHRTSFAFGLLWNHENLDRSIHDNIDRFFNGTYTKSLEHITRMGSKGMCLDNDLNGLLTETNLERLRGVPIMFISGSDNEVFMPEGTLKDYELLRRRFGEGMYRRFVPEGYGHLDTIVGKSADEDVWWKIESHLEWCSDRDCSGRAGGKAKGEGKKKMVNGLGLGH
ncbi:uncharacterized protein BDV14DRAFT_202097 [Aspergillus stella-maris]|uniref:uncharacterized protein n=1 Tax=Aspergillus stella-maris TaxID=1810926 RepID=UPI003CCD6065